MSDQPEQPVPSESASGSQIGEKKMKLILESIDRMPTLPVVAMKLMAISSAEDIDLDEVIRLIESDPAMSSTILAMCRTADKGLGDKITTVRRAVIMLGLEAVQVAALSVHVYQQLGGLRCPGWQACVRSDRSLDSFTGRGVLL